MATPLIGYDACRGLEVASAASGEIAVAFRVKVFHALDQLHVGVLFGRVCNSAAGDRSATRRRARQGWSIRPLGAG